MTLRTSMTKVGLISDTHGRLRSEVFDAFHGVDVILHAGDIGTPDIITALEALAPVRAVHGNTDGFDIRALYSEQVEVELEGKRVVMTHGHLFGSPKPAPLQRLYPDADVIVYGHTHERLLDVGPPVVINPGAAGPARFNLKPSVGLLELPSMRVTFVDL